MKNSRLLIDGDILCYRTCWAVQTEVEWDDGVVTLGTNLEELKAQVKQTIEYWKTKLEVDTVVIALSDQEGKYFRHKILEDYKAQRKSGRKPLGYKLLVKHLREEYTTMILPECEADDVLGILATDGTHDDIIISIDKDMYTIPCRYFNMDSETLEVISEDIADYMHLYQTLVGDPTDNYKGCPGIGAKRATGILREPGVKSGWQRVKEAFHKAGLTEDDALVQARVSRILRADDYDFKNEEVLLWSPA